MATSAHYFFEVQTPDQRYVDEAGTRFLNDHAAFTHARSLITELKSDGEYDYGAWVMVVRNTRGDVVFTIPF